ncbi:hypothetical protein D623_10029182 [Myotis brandtii]|uniref:Uncharacterized protein n=1 Tax=Myotis brandtii TaxID=109478 RepID=S7MR24_MYOBR|nr:hypothetical protein D623_10029182 [Myotis brandtii]
MALTLTQLQHCSPFMFTSQGSSQRNNDAISRTVQFPGKMSAAEGTGSPCLQSSRGRELSTALPHPSVLHCSGARELQPGSHLPPLSPSPLLTSFLPPCPLFASFLILPLLLTFCLRSLILGPVCQGHYIVIVLYNTDLFITVTAQVISE